MNSVNFIGRVVRDPVLKDFENTSVLNLTMVIDNNRKVGDEWKNFPTFIDCELWDAGAKRLSEKAVKGTLLALCGALKQENWEKDGNKYSKIKVRVSSFKVLDVKPKDTSTTTAVPTSEDDIPF